MASYDFSDEASATDRELADDLAKLGGLSEEQIAKLLPARVDQEQLKTLIVAVNSATSANQKRKALLSRLANVSETVQTVVKGLVKAAV